MSVVSGAQLVHSQEINHFRENFRKVFLALTKSSEDNKQLIRKCRMLGRNLAETGTKLHQVLEVKLKDDGLIQDLRCVSVSLFNRTRRTSSCWPVPSAVISLA